VLNVPKTRRELKYLVHVSSRRKTVYLSRDSRTTRPPHKQHPGPSIVHTGSLHTHTDTSTASAACVYDAQLVGCAVFVLFASRAAARCSSRDTKATAADDGTADAARSTGDVFTAGSGSALWVGVGCTHAVGAWDAAGALER
jgi:hypothetical protein